MPDPKPTPALLPAGYYLENLEQVLRFVSQHHRALLYACERSRLADFLSLSRDARRLYVRLYTRRGPCFRLSALSYDEIPSLREAAHELARRGFFALISSPADPAEAALLFDLLPREELLPIVKRRFFSLANKLKKEQLLAALTDHPEDWSALSSERFLYVLDAPLFSLCEVLFFGNRHQSLTDFVLVDLAKIKYYPYLQTRQPALFESREQLAGYLSAGEALQGAHELSTKEEALRLLQLATPHLERYQPMAAHQRIVDPGRYWQRLAFLAARECERHDEPQPAKEAYRLISSISADPHLQAEAIDRFGLLCQRQGEQRDFEALYQNVANRPGLDALALYQLETRRAKLLLGKDPKDALQKIPTISLSLTPVGHQGAKATYLGKTGAALPIELATLEALGGDGAWLENSLWLTLFGVLFWDVLFAPLPGVFVQPFQAGPLDLWSDSFYERRAALFDAQFQKLQEGILPVLTENDAKHRGYACSFTLWEACPAPLLERVVRSLGARLLPIMKRIAQHPNRHSNGLPDLIVFEGEALTLIEVKGPGDSLRLAQRLWHDHLLRAGVSIKIAKVQRA